MPNPNVIVLKGDPLRKELQAGAAVDPGDLVDYSSGDLIRHAVSGGNAAPRFAVENDLIGSGITDAYASGNTMRYVVSRAGDEIYGLLASGQSVSAGAFLQSAGNGALTAYTNQSGQNVYASAVVAVAAEDKNNTAGDATGPHNNATRIRLEVV